MLLTIETCLETTNAEDFDAADLAFSCAEFFVRNVGGSSTSVKFSSAFDAQSFDSGNHDTTPTADNSYLYGIGNALKPLCAVFYAKEFTNTDQDRFAVEAFELARNALVNHPKGSAFIGSVLSNALTKPAPTSATPTELELSQNLTGFLDFEPRWSFWSEWFHSFLDGRSLEPALQRRVVQIHDEIWESGPDAVAAEIERIRKELEQQQRAARAPIGPTDYEKSLVKKSVVQNRDAIVVSTAGLIEQVEGFREKIRGMNSLEAGIRSEILEFTDYFHRHLQQLLESLPQSTDDISEDLTGRIALWLRDYRGVLWTKLAHYSSPENMAEATVPTGIVLTATGIGAMLGQPLAGAAVGGLITNQMKSTQAAKELLKPKDTGETGDK